ncbi:lysine-rich nucleolar protein 1-like [Mercenaria mercenaria]|uniref:lysine-rich nucleolar protein 1-like n=1 Tax=Mercenaria mercenaria TaxID=6596 RepID=UPI00234E79D7|nr:lysine-rich nucleolar protein 1-like [Mercenaria mercenaria]XP_053405399.1 lysine-rich nucleolar protein 1-like [Mercenaria mercenaria]XP_053405400.1 lysine-rich nucleolar protein 1-like [Mercenaria mercenaria]
MDEAGSKTKKHKRKHKYDIEKKEEAEFCKTEKVIVEPNEFMSPVSERKKKKKKKKKSKDEESERDIVRECKIENETDIVEAVSNKRKVSEIENGHDEEKCEKKRKRKDKERDLESQNNISINSENACASADIQDFSNMNSKKKKKSKKKKMESDRDVEVGLIENADAIKQKEETKKNLIEITDRKEKKKHKKKKKNLSEPDEFKEKREIKESIETLCQDEKKKKKKDKRKDKNAEIEHEDTYSPNEKQESCVKERTKVVNSLETDSSQTQNKEKKSQGIDTEDENLKTGQWSGVELGDSERQNKFFRLLGGFKKGSDASQIQNKFSLGKKPAFSSANNFPKKTGGSFAMNKKQENIYTKALEGEYERAMTMNLNRGIGLGFEKPPEEGKKFYIDTKASKSIKFDN